MPAEIVIVANVWAEEQHLARVLELLEQDVAHTHANEPGALRFALHRDVEDPLHFVMVEAFQDQAALDAHRETDFYRELMAELPGLLAGRDRIVLEPLGGGDPERGHLA